MAGAAAVAMAEDFKNERRLIGFDIGVLPVSEECELGEYDVIDDDWSAHQLVCFIVSVGLAVKRKRSPMALLRRPACPTEIVWMNLAG